MIRQLFVLWRDPLDRTRHVIGRLWRDDGGFHFAYDTELGNARLLGFGLLSQFPEPRTWDNPYSSGYLFSTFLQRIPNPARPDYAAALQEMGVAAGDDPLEILARSGGVLMTDCIELAEYRADDEGLATPLTFRLAGERFASGATANLNEGDSIDLLREPENPHDTNATVVLRRGGQKVGYVPRYYARMLAVVLDGGATVSGTVERRIRMPEEMRWVVRIAKDGPGKFQTLNPSHAPEDETK